MSARRRPAARAPSLPAHARPESPLESVVQQVNADLGLEQDEDGEPTEADRGLETDRALAAAFRACADANS